MQSVVLILMIVVCFNFVLKQTFCKWWVVGAMALVAALFVGSMWGFAIEQSKTQIEAWLSNPTLMRDTSVLLCIEVILQMCYCILAVYIASTGVIKRRTLMLYRFLRWFPGLLIFPVLFSCLVQLIFALPGYSFSLVAWSLSAVVLVAIPLLSYLVKVVIPEKELRLELLFLANFLVAVLGIISTVNGRTAVAGTTQIDLHSLSGIFAIVVIGGLIGYVVRVIKFRKINKKVN